MLWLVRIAVVCIACAASAAHAVEGLTAFADALYWRASEETSAVWASVITPNVLVPTNQSTFEAADVRFDANPGVRTGLQFQPAADSWDAKLTWTYFATSGGDVRPVSDQTIVPESFSGFLSGDGFDFIGASVDWNLVFNNIDLELGREFPIGDSLYFRPAIGLKIAVIQQDVDTTWTNPIIGLDSVGRVDHDYWGVGPSFDLGVRWIVPRFNRLSLVGSLSGAFLGGVWNVTDEFHRTNPGLSPNTYQTFVTTLDDADLGTMTLRYFFGLEWTRPATVTTSVRLGYEMQWWANQQRMPTFQQLPMHGDLTLQGGSCGISFSY